MNVTHKNNPQSWRTKIDPLTHENYPRELPTIFTHELEPQELPTGLTHENYPQDPCGLAHSQINLKLLLLWKPELR